MTKKSAEKAVEVKMIVGIDLGTSRSAISASNGKKKWVDSYVGWPKDFIARKVVGKPILFGREALDHRLSLDLYRPLKNGVIKEGTARDEEAVKELIRHLISLVQTKNETEKVRAVVGVPAESFKVNKVAIKKAVAEYAESLLVVSEPFAVAYGVNALDNAMVIDIGAGTVDFCIMHGTVPTEDDQRTILTAGDYIDQQLYNFLDERYPHSDFNLNMVRRFKEEFSFIGEPERPVKVDIPVDGRPTRHDITEEMRRACESILPAIVESTLELIAKFDPEYQDIIRQNIILAGGGSQIRGLGEHLEEVLKEYGPAKVQIVDDPLYGGCDGALALAQDMPEDYWTDL
jgi:rod shape-determining protein MreB and related proteins